MLNFKVILHVVSQAYLRSSLAMSRTVYMKPKSENEKWLGVSEHEALKQRKPLYGLCDSGQYWNVRTKIHIVDNLGMVPSVSNL